MSGVDCVVCPFVDDVKTEKRSSLSSVISMRSCPPQYPRSSTPVNPSPSLFLFASGQQTVGMEGLSQEGTEVEREGGKEGERDEERQKGERDDSRE